MGKKCILIIIIITILISSISANHWSTHVSAGSSSWGIDRQSQSLNFELTGSVDGQISYIKGYNGRNLTPYSSYYINVEENEVKSNKRLNALEGNYQAKDIVFINSSIPDDTIDIFINKPVGLDTYTFLYLESWPVSLAINQSVEYSGKQINARDFMSNNGDFVKSSLLFNKVLKKQETAILHLENFSAVVLATNDNMVSANAYFNKSLDYKTDLHTTGIADVRYGKSDSSFDFRRQKYITASESHETYYGEFNISRKIHMSMGRTPLYEYEGDQWLPCCSGNLLFDQIGMNQDEAKSYSCIIGQGENDVNFWFKKGAAFVKLGNYSDAVAAFEKVIDISPSNATAWNQKGVALALAGRYNESISSFKNATEIDRMYSAAWYNMGMTLSMMDRYNEAIQSLDEAIHIDPREPGFWYAKGLALQALNREDESKIAFNKAQESANN